MMLPRKDAGRMFQTEGGTQVKPLSDACLLGKQRGDSKGT